MIYNCKSHGDIDANKAWGCPECVVELRKSQSFLQKNLDRMKEKLTEVIRKSAENRRFYNENVGALQTKLFNAERELAELKQANENRWRGGGKDEKD